MDYVLKNHFDKFRDRGLLPPELCNRRQCENVKLFGDNDKEKDILKAWRNNLKGIRWINENGNTLFGAVDNILIKDGRLIVLDYKTRGSKTKEDTAEHYRHQLDIYNFLLRKNNYKTEDYGFLLFYYPSNVLETGEVVFETELVKMEANPEYAEKLFEDAIKLLNEDCPEVKCNWCEKV